MRVYLASYLCLFGPTATVTPNERIQYFTMSTPTCTSAKREGLEREREWRRFKLNALAARTATCFLNYGESDDRVTRKATSNRQQDVPCFRDAFGMTTHTCSMDPPASSLTVKLSPCQCSQVVRLDESLHVCVGILNAICYLLRLAPGWFSIFLVYVHLLPSSVTTFPAAVLFTSTVISKSMPIGSEPKWLLKDGVCLFLRYMYRAYFGDKNPQVLPVIR